jgi:zinc D-Ala-D-Ala carboxypeptidase
MNIYQWIASGFFAVLIVILILYRKNPWVKISWKYIVASIPIILFALSLIKKKSDPVPTNSVIPSPVPSPVPNPVPDPITSVPATPVPASSQTTIGLDYVLSPHFNFGMMTSTENRKLLEQNRQQGLKYLDNLRNLCNNILEPIILLVGSTYISSCFRCQVLNVSVGGTKNSQHVEAEAADTHYNIPLNEAYNKIAASNLPFGQLIFEFSQWVHVSIQDPILHPGKVREKLNAARVNGKTVYTVITGSI